MKLDVLYYTTVPLSGPMKYEFFSSAIRTIKENKLFNLRMAFPTPPNIVNSDVGYIYFDYREDEFVASDCLPIIQGGATQFLSSQSELIERASITYAARSDWTHRHVNGGDYIQAGERFYFYQFFNESDVHWVPASIEPSNLIPRPVHESKSAVINFAQAMNADLAGHVIEYFDDAQWTWMDTSKLLMAEARTKQYWRIAKEQVQLGDYIFDAPVKSLEGLREVYIVSLTADPVKAVCIKPGFHDVSRVDKKLLDLAVENELLHLTPQAAAEHAKALIAQNNFKKM